MTKQEILDALTAIAEALTDEEGNERPMTDEEAERSADLEKQLQGVEKTEQFQARMRAYNTPVRTDIHIAVSGKDETSIEVRSMVHYLKTGLYDDYAMETRAQTKGTASAGGYLVPVTTQNKIVERMKAFGGLAEEAENITTDSGETINWATNDDTANTAEIVAEGGAAASAGADKVFGQTTLGAYKYEATGTGNLPMKVSWELLEDSTMNVEDIIAKNFATRIMRKFSVDIIAGNGTTAPQGIAAAQTAFDEITANATGPTYAELLGTVAALDPEYRANAKWLINDATWFRLLAMEDDNGRPLILPQASAGIGGPVPAQLLGYPVIIDQGMASIGDQAKFAVFGDLRESYIVRRVNGFHLLRLNELYAVNGFVGFLGWARMDGRVQNLNSYVVLAGENTA
jgi:HK97 family phage major capsid protein